MTCSEILSINLTSSVPFARGFVKSVWIGHRASGEDVIIKKPTTNDSKALTLFNEMLTKEIDLVRQLRASEFIMDYYGACRGIEMGVDQALAVEGPLINWSHLSATCRFVQRSFLGIS
jgi:hypothetical protein